MFKSVLIANRGEIAVRIARTLRKMGVRSVVAAAIPDRRSLAVRTADEFVLLEGYKAAETYLDIEAILAAATRTGCEAIHPGYGFLSERADFAEACERAGIVFVGPQPEVLRRMGNKSAARQFAVQLGIPVVPGWDGDDSDQILTDQAYRIGFPVLIKARGGGGGRGMRIIRSANEFGEGLASARREANAAFGDPTLLIEKLVTGAHHVEVQVFGDQFGNLVHLGERDCSVQRRYQKLVEESPSPIVNDPLRERLTDAALRLARAANYRNAGTVEFLVLPDKLTASQEDEFYFLEVNPRLQVEHPVTEAVTGLDLVEWQIRAAAGEALPLGQHEIAVKGHAIEFRLNAEDPHEGFRPSAGRIAGLRARGDGRFDLGYHDGDEIPGQYDSLIGKYIFSGVTREEALERAAAALRAEVIAGVSTNIGLLRSIASAPTFVAGNASTDWLESNIETLVPDVDLADVAFGVAAVAISLQGGVPSGCWVGAAERSMWLTDGSVTREVKIGHLTGDTLSATVGRQLLSCRVGLIAKESLRIAVGLQEFEVTAGHDVAGYMVLVNGLALRAVAPPRLPTRPHLATEGPSTITAPLSGIVAQVATAAGDKVEVGDLLLVLEAMKMEHRITAPTAGVIEAVLVKPGQAIRDGDELVRLA